MKKKNAKPSNEYRKILKYINSQPRLLSLLFDLDLLPEQIDTDEARRQMLAAYFGYRVGIDTNPVKGVVG